MLNLFETGISELPGVPRDVAGPVAVQVLFDAFLPESRELMKRGLVLALVDWRFTTHGSRTLGQLAQTAALIRASAAIPLLIAVLPRLRELGWEDCRPVLSTIVAVLSGFAPAPGIEEHLKELYYRHDTPVEIGGQLFIALCRCRPSAFPAHVPRCLELRERSGSGFPNLAAAFIHSVSPTVIVEQLQQIEGRHRGKFASMLMDVKNSPIQFEVARSGVQVWWPGDPTTRHGIPTSPQTMEIFEKLFQKALDPAAANAPLTSGGLNERLLRIMDA
jgi:hypothetical protein